MQIAPEVRMTTVAAPRWVRSQVLDHAPGRAVDRDQRVERQTLPFRVEDIEQAQPIQRVAAVPEDPDQIAGLAGHAVPLEQGDPRADLPQTLGGGDPRDARPDHDAIHGALLLPRLRGRAGDRSLRSPGAGTPPRSVASRYHRPTGARRGRPDRLTNHRRSLARQRRFATCGTAEVHRRSRPTRACETPRYETPAGSEKAHRVRRQPRRGALGELRERTSWRSRRKGRSREAPSPRTDAAQADP